MTRQRVRIRFSKQGDLRFIGHRDLARTFERWFRRAGVRLAMSQGFHPKAKMSFPAALGLGIAGVREVMEFELAEPFDAERLRQQLAVHAPPGLTVSDLRLLAPGEGKARARTATYEIRIPEPAQRRVHERVRHMIEQSSFWIERAGRGAPVDVKAGLDDLQFAEGVLRFRLTLDRAHGVRPQEVLQALEVQGLEREGCFLTRTELELAP